jgi:hypothetical protein
MRQGSATGPYITFHVCSVKLLSKTKLSNSQQSSPILSIQNKCFHGTPTHKTNCTNRVYPAPQQDRGFVLARHYD